MTFAPKKSGSSKEKDITDDNFYSFYIGKLEDSNGYGSVDWKCVELALKTIERKAKEKNGKPLSYIVQFHFHTPLTDVKNHGIQV